MSTSTITGDALKNFPEVQHKPATEMEVKRVLPLNRQDVALIPLTTESEVEGNRAGTSASHKSETAVDIEPESPVEFQEGTEIPSNRLGRDELSGTTRIRNETVTASSDKNLENAHDTGKIPDELSDNPAVEIRSEIVTASIDKTYENTVATAKRIVDEIAAAIAEGKQNVIRKITEDSPLGSLDILSQYLAKQSEPMEEDESFVTVEGYKDTAIVTEPVAIFGESTKALKVMAARTDAPPPYAPHDGGGYYRQGNVGSTPVYQYRTEYPPPPSDARQSPAYRPGGQRYTPYEEDVMDLFDNKSIRNDFVKKVYTILAAQLFFTFGFIALCMFEENIHRFVKRDFILMLLSAIVYFLVSIMLICVKSLRRSFPLNLILLALVTMALSYLTASISVHYRTYIVMITFGSTAAVCLLVTFIACQSWFDVTGCGMFLCIASLILMVFGLVAMLIFIFTGSFLGWLIYCCLATLLFSMYLMYDTQQVLGGRRIELSPEEYILGALTLYIDIMMIFIYLLEIIGLVSR